MLTAQQSKLLIFVHNYTRENKYCPSFKEMQRAVGLQSTSGVYRLIKCLEEREYVRSIPRKARSIEVLRLPHKKIRKRKGE